MRLRPPTFLLALLLGLAFCLPAFAGTSLFVRKLPNCKNSRDGDWYAVKDGASTSDCTTGGGDTRVMCGCNNGVWSAFLAVPTSISFAGQVAITATGAGNDVSIAAPDTIAFDAAGGTDELGIAANLVSVASGVAFQITASPTPPVACAAGTKGTIYIDSDVNFPCHCDGTSYKKLTDNTTATGCS